MERAANARATEYSRYGSTIHKQVYIYGGLDRGPTELNRNFGMAWGVAGCLLTPVHDQRRGGRGRADARPGGSGDHHHVRQLVTPQRVDLAEALDLDAIGEYGKQATGTKYLITPHG